MKKKERTHCKHGHAYAEVGYYAYPSNYNCKMCRACHKINAAKRNKKVKKDPVVRTSTSTTLRPWDEVLQRIEALRHYCDDCGEYFQCMTRKELRARKKLKCCAKCRNAKKTRERKRIKRLFINEAKKTLL